MNYHWDSGDLHLYDENLVFLDARSAFIDWCDTNKYLEYEKTYNRGESGVEWTPVGIDSLMRESDIVIDFIQNHKHLFCQVEEE